MIQTLHQIDRELTLALNGLHCPASDAIWMLVTEKKVWFLLYAIAIIFLFKQLGWKKALVVIASVALSVGLLRLFLGSRRQSFWHGHSPGHGIPERPHALLPGPGLGRLDMGFPGGHQPRFRGKTLPGRCPGWGDGRPGHRFPDGIACPMGDPPLPLIIPESLSPSAGNGNLSPAPRHP